MEYLIPALLGLVVLIVFFVTCGTVYNIKAEAKKQTNLMIAQLELLKSISEKLSK